MKSFFVLFSADLSYCVEQELPLHTLSLQTSAEIWGILPEKWNTENEKIVCTHSAV